MSVQVKEVCRRLKLDNSFAVDRIGKSGGLALIWSSDINVRITSYSRHHIDMQVQKAYGKLWKCTGIYRHPETKQKKHTWTLLKRLAGLSSLPWLCFGDFKEILNLNKKTGDVQRDARVIADFRDAVKECKLIDLGSRGHPFTWSNRQFGPYLIEEKLDRFLHNQEWRAKFYDDLATNLVHLEFDHCSVMVEAKEKEQSLEYDKKYFCRIHYEDMWSLYKACKDIVKNE